MRLAPSSLLRPAVAALAGAALAGAAFGQATIDNPSATAAQIATRLQGSGVTITNPDIPAANNSDAPTMYGLFSNGIAGAGLQIDTGAALSTGSIAEMFTSNSAINSSIGGTTTYSDPDVVALEAGATRNVALITMDVTLDPYVTGLAMRYQFGSDEYPDYAGSTFNDLFAVFLSGPGITGNENIADLPNGGQVDINTVNFGTRGCNGAAGSFSTLNTPYYIRNGHIATINGGTGRLNCNTAPQPGPFPVVMEWNGLTTALTAERTGLTPGATYRLKLAVADVLDEQYDSGAVFEVIQGTYDRDYGDAPNTGGYGNPYHEIRSPMLLGTGITAETNGYNSPTASGDVDDAVTMPVFQAGVTTNLNIRVAGTGGYLQAFFDWNADGDFNDVGEQVAVNLQDTGGTGFITLAVTPPASASTYNTYARLRWSTQQNLNATANALDGEVEDYYITVTGGATVYSCPSGFTPITKSGNASSVVTTAEFSNNALGAILAAGAATNNANSARVRTGFLTLGVRLADIVPGGAPITVSLARDNNAGNVAIDTSPDGVTYTQQATFNAAPNDIAQRISFNAPAGGVEYMRFRRTAGDIWIDGVQYAAACQPTPRLEGSKSITVYDPAAAGLYALPGNDVIYTINVANTGAIATDANSVVVIDQIPAEVSVFAGPTPEFGGGVVGWSQTGTGLTFTPGTDLRWSDSVLAPAGFGACTYTPGPGYDSNIRFICVNPKGAMASGNPDPNFNVSFRARIR